MDGPSGVFLSAVTSEFGRARQETTDTLAGKHFEVKVQEQFEQGGDTLLRQIHDYIHDCLAVVAIVGTRSGAFPEDEEVKDFAEVVSKVGLAPGRYSYTEWELIFAHHYDRKMFVYFATPEYQPDRPTPEGDRPDVQERVIAWLRSQGREWREFANSTELQLLILKSKLDTIAGVRRSATGTDKGLDVEESPTPAIRPRDPAEWLRLPRNRPGIIGREHELEDLLAEADSRREQLVMVVGPAGIGKKALLQELSNRDDLPTDLANGAGIHPGYKDHDGLEDMQQAVWRQFFEAPDPSTVDPVRRLSDLQDIESLIVLPDVDSSVEHLEPLLDSIPNSFFYISALEDNTESLPGWPIPLDPLDDDATIALFEDRSRVDVAAEVRPGILQLCDGNPGGTELLAREAAKFVRRHRNDPDPLASWVESQLGGDVTAAAPDSDAAAMAMAATAAVGREVPRPVLEGVSGSPTAIDEAVADRKLEEGSPRYRLNPVLVADGEEDQTAADDVMDAVFEQTMVWIEGAPHPEIFANRSFVVRMMQWGTGSGQRVAAAGDADSMERARRRLQAVITLGVTAESSMALGGRHGAWEQLLDEVQRAAEALLAIEPDAPPEREENEENAGSDAHDATTTMSGEEALGWVFHERGSRALLRDELDDARLHLNRSLRHRTSDVGRELTRKNLKLAPLAVLPFTVLFVLAALVGSLAVVQGAPFDKRPPSIDISPDTADFDAGSPEQAFEIHNIGESSIWLKNAGIVDAGEEKVDASGGFEMVWDADADVEQPCAEGQLIEAGDFCTVTVRYTREVAAIERLGVEIESRSDREPTGDQFAVLVAAG